MPRLDQTGPLGRGPRTGWALGRCRSRPAEEAEASPPDDERPPAWFWRRGEAGLGGWRRRWRGGRGWGWGRRD